MKKLLNQIWTVLSYLSLRLIREGFTYRAASLAYATLLAIVPLMIVSFSILAFFPAFHGVEKQLQHFVLQNFVAESASVISDRLSEFVIHVHKLSAINVVFLVILDLLMLYNIQRAFDSVWHAKPKFNVSIAFLIYFVILLISPIVFGGVLVLGSLIYKMTHFSTLIHSSGFKNVFYFLLPHLITLFMFTVFNWILPSARVKFRHALIGGLLTTIIFELAKYGFSFYLTHFHTYRLVYGALATLPLFLIWLYVSWLIILLGALVTNLVAKGIPKQWKKLLNERYF